MDDLAFCQKTAYCRNAASRGRPKSMSLPEKLVPLYCPFCGLGRLRSLRWEIGIPFQSGGLIILRVLDEIEATPPF